MQRILLQDPPYYTKLKCSGGVFSGSHPDVCLSPAPTPFGRLSNARQNLQPGWCGWLDENTSLQLIRDFGDRVLRHPKVASCRLFHAACFRQVLGLTVVAAIGKVQTG